MDRLEIAFGACVAVGILLAAVLVGSCVTQEEIARSCRLTHAAVISEGMEHTAIDCRIRPVTP